MEETGCHIHFPDSNRSNHQEKSNQVSIAGEIEGVERARARVRVSRSDSVVLPPCIVYFLLTSCRRFVLAESHSSDIFVRATDHGRLADNARLHLAVRGQDPGEVQRSGDVPHQAEIARHFGGGEGLRVGGVSSEGGHRASDPLHVPKFSCEYTIVVPLFRKSCSSCFIRILLFSFFFLRFAQSQIQVQMSMEISPQHHSVVLGKQSSNLKMIMQRTGTQIMFPDAGDPNIPSLKKSNVTIIGGIHNVYLARQQLVVGREYRLSYRVSWSLFFSFRSSSSSSFFTVEKHACMQTAFNQNR